MRSYRWVMCVLGSLQWFFTFSPFLLFNLTLWLTHIFPPSKEGTRQTQDREGCLALEQGPRGWYWWDWTNQCREVISWCCFIADVIHSVFFYSGAFQNGSQIIKLENQFYPILKKKVIEINSTLPIPFNYKNKKKLSAFSNIWLNLTLLAYRDNQTAEVEMIFPWLDLVIVLSIPRSGTCQW